MPILTAVTIEGLRFVQAHIDPRPTRQFLRQFDQEIVTMPKPFYIAIDLDNTPLQRMALRRGARKVCEHGPHWIGIKHV